MNIKHFILFSFLIFAIQSQAQRIDTIGSFTVELDTIKETCIIFFETNNYAISVDSSDVYRNIKYFKRSLRRRLKDSIANDTIWINDYFKPRERKDMNRVLRYISFRTVSRREGVVINLQTGEYVKSVECKIVESLDEIYTLVDVSKSTEILRYVKFFIGTPSF
jgi:hypothetical protein